MKTSPTKTAFPFELGGEALLLAYPITALWAYEDASGVDVELVLKGKAPAEDDEALTPEKMAQEAAVFFDQGMFGTKMRERVERITKFCWAGLLLHQPDIKLEDVQKHVYVSNVPTILEKCLAAFLASLTPQKEDEDEKEESPLEKKQSASRGTKSGRSAASTSA